MSRARVGRLRWRLCAALAISVCCAFPVQAAPLPVKVGVLLSRTGPMADIGQEGEHGIRLAICALQAELHSEQLDVTFLFEDSRSSPDGAVTAVNKLLESDGVDVVLGDLTSTATLAAAPLAQRKGVPLLTPSSTSDKVTRIGDHIFRACYVDSFQGIAMARYAFDSLHARRAAMLVDLDVDHSRDVSVVFAREFARLGGSVLQTLSFSGSHDISYVSQMTQLRRLHADVIYAPVYYNRMATLFRYLRSFRVPAQVLGTDAWDSPQLFALAHGATAGAILTDPFSPQNPAPPVQAFRRAFVATYHVEPSSYAALAYDATHVLAAALRQLTAAPDAAPLPAQITAHLAKTHDVPGVTGTITLDAARNVQAPDVVLLRLTADGYRYESTLASPR